jgi:hypothetical protein
MSDDIPIAEKQVETECPKCGHKFWHKIGRTIKHASGEITEALGNAIGEAKFGGDS